MTEHLDRQRRNDLILEGENARSSGRPKDVCPYPLDSLERMAWMEGFDGEAADQGPDLPIDQS